MNESKTIREVVGGNVAARRSRLGESQAAFGKRIGAISGDDWSIKAVSEMERGKRALSADDVLLLARAVGEPPSALFLIPAGVDLTDAAGEPVPRIDAQRHPDDAHAYLHEFATAATQWRERVQTLREEVTQLQEEAGRVYAALGVVTSTLKSLGNDAQDIHAQAALAGMHLRQQSTGTAPEVGTI